MQLRHRFRAAHAIGVGVATAGAVAVAAGFAIAQPAHDERHEPRAESATVRPSLAAHLPAAVASSPPARVSRRVFVVGDSLTVGAEPWLRAALRRHGWTLTGVDARVGRPVAEGLSLLRAHRTRLPGTVVIALGTNDLGAGSQTVRSWLRSARAIAGPRRLVWVDLCLAPAVDPRLAAYRQINQSLFRYAARFGVVVADWCGYAASHHVRPGLDGIHYGPDGYRQRASFYAAAVAAAG
jgi:lysophospholipase L1-like esterase